MIDEKNTKIAIVGLGYVGLPLAIEFGKYFETIGFDLVDNSRDWTSAQLDLSKTEKQLRKEFKHKWRGDLNAS